MPMRDQSDSEIEPDVIDDEPQFTDVFGIILLIVGAVLIAAKVISVVFF